MLNMQSRSNEPNNSSHPLRKNRSIHVSNFRQSKIMVLVVHLPRGPRPPGPRPPGPPIVFFLLLATCYGLRLSEQEAYSPSFDVLAPPSLRIPVVSRSFVIEHDIPEAQGWRKPLSGLGIVSLQEVQPPAEMKAASSDVEKLRRSTPSAFVLGALLTMVVSWIVLSRTVRTDVLRDRGQCGETTCP